MNGELAAITCAASFALCSIAFAAAGRVVGSMVVNQLRIFLAAVFLLGAHLAMFGEFWPSDMSSQQVWLLALSGIVGLSLGDLFYFHALAVLGPRLGTLLMATFPVFVVLGEGVTRGEWPGLLDGVAMAVIVGGVMLVLTGKKAANAWRSPGGSVPLAVVAGLLGAVGQGMGIVIAKIAEDVAHSGGQHSLSVTLVRMLAGLGGMLIVFGAQQATRSPERKPRPMTSRAFWLILIGVVFGPTLGVWLSMVALQRVSAGRASVLIGLTPVLMLPIVWVAWRERPTLRGGIGTLVAFAGIVALLWESD